MQKFTPVLVATTIAVGIVSVFLWQQLHEERARTAELQKRVTALELAQERRPVWPNRAQVPAAAGEQTATGPAVVQQGADGADAAPNRRAAARGAAAAMAANARDILQDPAARSGIAGLARQALAQRYPDLARELGLSPEQAGKLLDLLANNQLATLGSALGSRTDGSSPQDLRSTAQEAQLKQDEEIRTLLGDAKAQQWKEYQDTLPARQEVARFRTSLEAGGQSLSQGQQRQLTSVLAAEQKRSSAEATQVAQITGSSTSRDPAAALAQNIQRTEESNRRVLDSAAIFLNGQQLDALQAQQEQRLQLTRTMQRFQGARRSGGSGAGGPIDAGAGVARP